MFVFKNYDKPVLRLESIDIKDFEGVKNWLDKVINYIVNLDEYSIL